VEADEVGRADQVGPQADSSKSKSMAKNELRFSNLVAASGNPQVVSLWTKPEEDRVFMKAVKQNRVLTLIQPSTTKHKVYAIVGFQKQSSYLVFPSPLPVKQPLRVVGIKDELLSHPGTKSQKSEKRRPLKNLLYVHEAHKGRKA
jgi:hypothetical protein